MADLLPDGDPEAAKRGFGVPLDRWFREDLRSYVGQHARGTRRSGAAAPRRAKALERMLADHHAGARNHGHALWTLLTLEVFLRREGW